MPSFTFCVKRFQGESGRTLSDRRDVPMNLSAIRFYKFHQKTI